MSDRTRVVSRLLRSAAGATAAAYILAYFFVVAFRIGFPFELEWLEGSLVNHVIRILDGQRLYVRPSLDFVPFFYTPLYFYVSAAVAKVTGVGFLPLRLVSVVSSAGCLAVIFLFVKRQTGNGFAALLSTGLFAATFRMSGAWLDIGRVDSLFLFLILLGLFLIKFGETRGAWVLAAIAFSLSFLTKQTALAISLPIALYCFLSDLRRAVLFLATMAGAIGVSTYVLNHLYDGWYVYYVFGIPAGHPLLKNLLIQFWTADILAPLGFACGMAAIYFSFRLFDSNKRDLLFYFLATGAMVGASWISRVHEGGFDNVLLTAYAMLAILFGLGADLILKAIHDCETRSAVPWAVSAYLVILLQFAVLFYNPLTLIPTAQDEEAGWNLVDRISKIQGEVFVPFHSYLPYLAGKRCYAHGEALYSIMSSDRGEGRTNLINELHEAAARRKFQVVILDVHRSGGIWTRGVGPADFQGYCFEKAPLFLDENTFWPTTGVEVRPQLLMSVCPDAPPFTGVSPFAY